MSTPGARPSHRVGVCSWSLQPSSATDLVAKVRATGLSAVQLHLDPLRTGEWPERPALDALEEAGIAVLSGMMTTRGEDYSTLETIARTGGLRPDSTWPENREAAARTAALAQRMGLRLVTLHAGFLPHDAADPERARLLERLRTVADLFSAAGVTLGLETGQESAHTLLEVLRDLDHPGVAVNFDPANMILYGMGDPIAALRDLAPHIAQVHIKDATPTRTPGTWGTEVPAGTGAVNWSAFFRVLGESLPRVDLLIEREAGESRVSDIAAARALVGRYAPGR